MRSPPSSRPIVPRQQFPTPPPKVIGMYDEPPDELGDEELFEHRARVRAFNPRRPHGT